MVFSSRGRVIWGSAKDIVLTTSYRSGSWRRMIGIISESLFATPTARIVVSRREMRSKKNLGSSSPMNCTPSNSAASKCRSAS